MLRRFIILFIAGGLSIILTFFQQILLPKSIYHSTIRIDSVDYSVNIPLISSEDDCLIEIEINDKNIGGIIYYHTKANSAWDSTIMSRLDDKLVTLIPVQVPNTRCYTMIKLINGDKTYFIGKDKPLEILFIGKNPRLLRYSFSVLFYIYIFLCIFIGALALDNQDNIRKYIKISYYILIIVFLISLITFFIEYRNYLVLSSPYDNNTFHKILLMLVCWYIVYRGNKNNDKRIHTILGSLVNIILYCTPYNFSSILEIFKNFMKF